MQGVRWLLVKPNKYRKVMYGCWIWCVFRIFFSAGFAGKIVVKRKASMIVNPIFEMFYQHKGRYESLYEKK